VPGRDLLGLTYGEVRLAESDPGWPTEALRLAETLDKTLERDAVAIKHIGSTAVPGLVSKPILDLAVGLAPDAETDRVIERLRALGCAYRGDAGEAGGLIFVLEDKPGHRIAHVHAVRYGDRQWTRYLRVRDRLRADAGARAAYGELKRRLAAEFPRDRTSYTAAKASFFADL
jgi:GrpB-like predicted nucleotidyltransferase (UPF0157 family)